MNNAERQDYKEELEKQRQDEEMYSIEMAAAAALPGWVHALHLKKEESNYSNEVIAIEAARLSIVSGDALINLTKSYKLGLKNSVYIPKKLSDAEIDALAVKKFGDDLDPDLAKQRIAYRDGIYDAFKVLNNQVE